MIPRAPHALLLLPVTLALLAVPTIVDAQSRLGLAPEAELAQQRAAQSRAATQAQQAQERSETLEARANLANAAADRTRDQAATLAARIQQSEADLKANIARLDSIRAQQRAQAHRLAQQQAPIVRLSAALQQIARRSPALALVEPGAVDDAVHRRIILSQFLPRIMAKTRGLRSELARTRGLRRDAEQTGTRLAALRGQLQDQRKTLALVEQRLRIASRQLHATASAENERALAMGEEARDIGDLMSRIKASGTVREALLALPGPTLRPASLQGNALPMTAAAQASSASQSPPRYRLPVVGDVKTGFGELTPTGLMSRGLVIATAPRATVVAPASGRIAFAGPFRGYGQILIIEHGHGWTSLVANLATLSAAMGDELRQGDLIGSATNDPRAQIILELRKDNEPTDIAALLR